MSEMEEASQQVSESESQLAPALKVVSEVSPEAIVATADMSQEALIAELDRRVRDLEAAMGDLRTVKASAGVGRKTVAAKVGKPEDMAGLDASLRSLDVEQRIAVKSGLMRAGLL